MLAEVGCDGGAGEAVATQAVATQAVAKQATSGSVHDRAGEAPATHNCSVRCGNQNVFYEITEFKKNS